VLDVEFDFEIEGEGHAREMDTKCTVFKRNIDQSYGLKMKSSRALYSEIVRRFGTLPFSLTYLSLSLSFSFFFF
jgi:hypothetical protein